MPAVWDERATLSFPNGRGDATAQSHHTVERPTADRVTITTAELVLEYDRSKEAAGSRTFSSAALAITLSGTGNFWHPGDNSTGNLGGSRLDLGCYGTFDSCYSSGLSPGPLSTAGWAVLDDTVGVRMQTAILPEMGIPWYSSTYPCDPAHPGVCGPTTTDWYFFGHGHRFKDAMADFAMVSGAATMPPRAAFGVWWSTWYGFSQHELSETVLKGYADHGLPLDVVVLDMDWHTAGGTKRHPSATNCSSGFTWNTAKFPNPHEFVDLMHSDGNALGHPLALSLNGHQQTGVGPCQANYTTFCEVLGVNPAIQAHLPCNLTSPRYVEVCRYMTQPLVELYGGCMVVLKVS
jgi:alpha-glucosidase